MDDLQRLLAREEIRQLTHLYSHHRDRPNLEDLVELFTEDATCQFGPDLGGDVVGRDAIRRHFAASIPRFGDGKPYGTMHAVTNHWINFTGPDEAEGRCFLIDFLIGDARNNPLYFLGIYDDTFRRVNGKWKIHRRRLELAWPPREATDRVPQ